ncbi:hypothetical protein BGZ76_002290 [Entomortierella beljakovae]|nr:hypothetical protein BGZ76_002290 [Entomortierella beljakovae]
MYKLSTAISMDADFMDLIYRSWKEIPSRLVHTSFNEFFSAISNPVNVKPLQKDGEVERSLREELFNLNMPDSIIKYYIGQDADTGPSDLMYSAIHYLQQNGELLMPNLYELRYVTCDMSEPRYSRVTKTINMGWSQARNTVTRRRLQIQHNSTHDAVMHEK